MHANVTSFNRHVLLTGEVPDEATRNRILVSNPETLYGFPKTA